jgi:hypothetical protein
MNNQQLAGWKVKYNFLDLVVVRGAGHVKIILLIRSDGALGSEIEGV